MKKILCILGMITLIGTSTTSLVACNTPQEYTPEQLAQLKKENKINTANQEIKNNLEWIEPQEKPFNKVDNKYYFLIWRGDKNSDWRIVKYQNSSQPNSMSDPNIKIDTQNNNVLWRARKGELFVNKGLFFVIGEVPSWYIKDIKMVYRWNNDNEPNKDVENQLKSYLDL